MVRKKAEQELVVRPKMFDGNGEVLMRKLLTGPEEMHDKGRLFATFTIEPGNSIGYHVHEHESETFFVLRGKGTFDDNGTKIPFEEGDVLHTVAGSGHSVLNTGDETLEFVGLIIYE